MQPFDEADRRRSKSLVNGLTEPARVSTNLIILQRSWRAAQF